MEKLFDKCPICGSTEMTLKKVKTIIKGGYHTVEVEVEAEVCHKCGERLYPPQVARLFEKLKKQMETGKLKNLKPVGTAFQLV